MFGKMYNTKAGFALVNFTGLIILLVLIAAGLKAFLTNADDMVTAIMTIVSAIGGYLTGKVGGEFADGKEDNNFYPEYKPQKAGCTDPKAKNFDPEATIDNGTCIYEANPGNEG